MEIKRNYFSIRLSIIIQTLINVYTFYGSSSPLDWHSFLGIVVLNLIIAFIFYLDFLQSEANRIILRPNDLTIDRKFNLFQKDSIFPVQAIESVRIKKLIGRSLLSIELRNGMKKRVSFIAGRDEKIKLRSYFLTIGVSAYLD